MPGPAARLGLTGNHLRTLALRTLASTPVVPRESRYRLLKLAGVDTSPATFSEGVFLGDAKLTTGTGCYIAPECFLDTFAGITLGNHVDLAPRVVILTSTHEIGPSHHRAGANSGAPVVIGDGCWIGAGATVLPGVTIAPGCVVAAGSLVTKDTEPNGLYVGSPARRVKDLD